MPLARIYPTAGLMMSARWTLVKSGPFPLSHVLTTLIPSPHHAISSYILHQHVLQGPLKDVEE